MSRSYYNRPWQGFIEVAGLGGEWVRAHGPVGSVEEGLAFIAKTTTRIPSLEWRIVDLGGNVYEHGVVQSQSADMEMDGVIYMFKSDPIPDEVAARQLAFYKRFIEAPEEKAS